MQSSLLAEDDGPDAAALAAAVAHRGTVNQYDELRAGLTRPGAPAELAPLWRQFFDSLGAEGWADLRARQLRVQQRVREDGATYNVYAEQAEASRPWPLELLPFLVSAEDWAVIEQGVQQRAKLLELTLADIYGPQTLLRDALLPPPLVFAHPQYLRPVHGLWPRGNTHLHIAAFDLARTPDGGFTVLAQRLQAPSGLGYLLENRLIIGPQLHDEFFALRVQRLASTFRSLLDGLMQASPAGERSRIVLLTPGPLNETYFEQVFLARYLGVTLVEGSDLTVRGNRLYLKTLHGLERVHVLLRRVDDEFLDPLELRPDSALGVPGLLQALRAGELVMANAPGAGFLESLGLSAFWPAVAERLLGQELLLPAPTTWWCGEAAVWAAQREHLDEFIVVPTFPSSGIAAQVVARLDDKARADLIARIDADPAAYTLLVPQRPSETPVWAEGQLWPRAAVMRVYALADGSGGWRVLPGALTRVAGRDEAMHDPLLSMQSGSASVDTWVIASGAVDRTSLLPKALSAAELEGWHRTVSSRAAENLFWLGRYTERAENSARLARVMLEALPEASEPVLRLLDALARHHGLVDSAVPAPWQSMRLFERALVHGLGLDSELTSVSYNLRALRDCAQALRERLSPEHWKLIHEVGDHFEHHLGAVLEEGEGHVTAPDVLGVLARAATHLAAITGAQTDRMTRDDGWRLLSVGRQIERLDMLSHALALGFEHGVHEADDGFAVLLGLFDSIITYRAQFQARREVLPLLHLLVFDTDNPRSLAWVARTMRERLRKLARQDAAWVAQITAALPAPETWSLEKMATPDAGQRLSDLIEALNGCSQAARTLSDEIGRHLFVHVVSEERSVWQ
ncbi:circularly permuted type 2 ATP-grasp protein [Aquabacterium sp.]|uniref:circularly permuted type 2 ATP-grasp protein n=1 Tax=Aquabacterium sp. TaxID=1872578 RepID=UPI002C8082E2|nr:circularly permuted type 2 ATP-grasp protein [Aquabacterium sp.]HSW03178.1 circularly permuted type 2 ATP-grasp protein [Aquabacterium sp.]